MPRLFLNPQTIVLRIFALPIMVFAFCFQAKAQDTTNVKPSVKLSGMIFGDFEYRPHYDSLFRGTTQYAGVSYPSPKNYSSFDIRRIYLGGDFVFSKSISGRVLLSNESNTDNQKNATFSIKEANISWNNIYKNASLVIGRSATPAFAMLTEKVWGYRSIEKTISDMRYIATAVDLGVSLRGKFNDSGTVGYNLMMGNGSVGAIPNGQKPEDDMFKKFYGDIWAKFADKKIILDLYGDFEKQQLADVAAGLPYKAKYTVKGFAAYQTKKMTIGVEAFAQMLQNASIYTKPGSTKVDTSGGEAIGISAYLTGSIYKEKLGFFARYDIFNPDTKYNPNYAYTTDNITFTERFITAGLDWMPVKNLHFMPNIWIDSYHERALGSDGMVKNDNDYDMSVRITFYYIYN